MVLLALIIGAVYGLYQFVEGDREKGKKILLAVAVMTIIWLLISALLNGMNS